MNKKRGRTRYVTSMTVYTTATMIPSSLSCHTHNTRDGREMMKNERPPRWFRTVQPIGVVRIPDDLQRPSSLLIEERRWCIESTLTISKGVERGGEERTVARRQFVVE